MCRCPMLANGIHVIRITDRARIGCARLSWQWTGKSAAKACLHSQRRMEINKVPFCLISMEITRIQISGAASTQQITAIRSDMSI